VRQLKNGENNIHTDTHVCLWVNPICRSEINVKGEENWKKCSRTKLALVKVGVHVKVPPTYVTN